MHGSYRAGCAALTQRYGAEVARFTLTAIDGLTLPPPVARPRFNIAHGDDVAVIDRDGTPRTMRWGLLAPWRGHGGTRGPMTFEVARDAIDDAPLTRTAYRKRRCLVLADGFYAWWHGRRAKRQPYWIHPVPGRTTYLAGISATHRDDDRASVALVIVPAAPPVAPIASTMPLVVDARWLDAPDEAALALDGWRADAVSSWVDNIAHDDARCIAPLGNPAQGRLF